MDFLEITDSLTMVDEGHLGGFIIQNDPATFLPNLWKYICETYSVKSVIDVGCGMGYSIPEFKKYANKVIAIDGSEYVKTHSPLKDLIKQFDFSKEKYLVDEIYDLAWSSEFVEHVHEKYIDNYFDIFKNSRYCAITYADIQQSGHHHVNCQSENYWIKKFEDSGFEFLHDELKVLKEQAYKDAITYNPQYKDNHFYNRGLFFKNKGI